MITHLEIPPLCVLIHIAVSYVNCRTVWAFSQTLVILHQLIGLIYSEKLCERDGEAVSCQAIRQP